MILVEFTKHYPDEAGCRIAIKQYTEQEEIKYKKSYRIE